MTDGIVAFQEDTNNKGTLEDDTPQETRKRKRSAGNEDVSSKKKRLSKESIVDAETQQEISENHIGESHTISCSHKHCKVDINF